MTLTLARLWGGGQSESESKVSTRLAVCLRGYIYNPQQAKKELAGLSFIAKLKNGGGLVNPSEAINGGGLLEMEEKGYKIEEKALPPSEIQSKEGIIEEINPGKNGIQESRDYVSKAF